MKKSGRRAFIRAQISKYLSARNVDKIVDFFREFSEEIQDSPLAKGYYLLLYDSTPYLSITIQRPFSCRGGMLPAAPLTPVSGGYPQIPINKM